MYVESSSDEEETTPLPPPCHTTTSVCQNVGGRCWFTSAMTFINKAYDQLPHNTLVEQAFAFSQELVGACNTSRRQTLLCKKAPKPLLDLYKQYFWEYVQMVKPIKRYHDSKFRKLLGSGIRDQYPFWAKLFEAAQQRPVTMTAQLSDPVGDRYETLELKFKEHVVAYNVLGDGRFNTKKALADVWGYIPYYVPGTATFAPTTQKSGINFDINVIFEDDPPTVVYKVTAGDTVGVAQGGYGELLLAAMYSLPGSRVFSEYRSVPAIDGEELTFPEGVEIITVSKTGLLDYRNLAEVLDGVRAALATQPVKVIGGLFTIETHNAFHELSFFVCGNSNTVMVCDPNSPECETSLRGGYPTGSMVRAHIVLCREDAPARKRVKVMGSFVDLAALCI